MYFVYNNFQIGTSTKTTRQPSLEREREREREHRESFAGDERGGPADLGALEPWGTHVSWSPSLSLSLFLSLSLSL